MERGPLTTAAKLFEKLAWIFCDRIQLEDGVNSIKYLVCTSQCPAVCYRLGIPGAGEHSQGGGAHSLVVALGV